MSRASDGSTVIDVVDGVVVVVLPAHHSALVFASTVVHSLATLAPLPGQSFPIPLPSFGAHTWHLLEIHRNHQQSPKHSNFARTFKQSKLF